MTVEVMVVGASTRLEAVAGTAIGVTGPGNRTQVASITVARS